MTYRFLQLAFSLIVIATYSLLFYNILSLHNVQDFTSFYSAILNLVDHKNPYEILYSHFLAKPKKLSANLNPPFVLALFSFLSFFTYKTALAIWIFLSFILGLIGASLAFYHAFSYQFLKRNWLNLFLIYLSLFSTLINISTAQIGFFLLFFIMTGYHFYIKNKSLAAGFSWAFAVAFKFFPALLFVFVLKQRRMKAFYALLFTTLVAFLIPLLIYGPGIYTNYFAMFSRVFWYGDNWNASIFGYIVRLFTFNPFFKISLIYLKVFYVFVLFLSLLWYLKNLGPSRNPAQGENAVNEVNHQPFCLTLTMMLIMSPFGWLYYFPILILPLLLTGINAYNSKVFIMLVFLFSLFLIDLPQGYLLSTKPAGFLARIICHSAFFYGLLLLNYLCSQSKLMLANNELSYDPRKQGFIWICLFILYFGLVYTLSKALS